MANSTATIAIVSPTAFCPEWWACSVCSCSSCGSIGGFRFLSDCCLLSMQKFQSLLRFYVPGHVIVFQHTDGAIHLQNSQSYFADGAYTMFAQGPLDFVYRYVLLGAVGSDDLAVVNKQRGRALNHAAKSPV